MASSNPSASSHDDDATSFLRGATFSTGQSSPIPFQDVPSANDLLNPSNFDPAKLHPMSGLGDKLDYLLLDDDKTNQLPGAETALPSRGWSDDLCYGTGTTYLAGEYRPKLDSAHFLTGEFF